MENFCGSFRFVPVYVGSVSHSGRDRPKSENTSRIFLYTMSVIRFVSIESDISE